MGVLSCLPVLSNCLHNPFSHKNENRKAKQRFLLQTKTKIFDLPSDLIEEILSRVPLKSLRAVRSTCRAWNSVSKSQRFAKKHIAKVSAATREGESQMIMMMDYNLSLRSVLLGDVNRPSTELKVNLPCFIEQVGVSRVYHCEGLLLGVLDGSLKLVVWNPYLGETNWVESRYYHSLDREVRFNYALGYEVKNSGGHSHKILRFLEVWIGPDEERFFWYEIYDFESGLWKTLDVNPDWAIMCHHTGVSFNGNTYWCASERNSQGGGVDDHIICFDFTTERFGPLMRLPFDAGDDDYPSLSCVREEKLAVLLGHNEETPYRIDVWISTKIEADNVLWSKFLTVDMESIGVDALIAGGFFIDEEKKVVMGFEEETFQIVGEGGYYIEIDFGRRVYLKCRGTVYTYVPTPVQIKQLEGGERREQTDLEKLLFDQNMSRLAEVEARRIRY